VFIHHTKPFIIKMVFFEFIGRPQKNTFNEYRTLHNYFSVCIVLMNSFRMKNAYGILIAFCLAGTKMLGAELIESKRKLCKSFYLEVLS